MPAPSHTSREGAHRWIQLLTPTHPRRFRRMRRTLMMCDVRGSIVTPVTPSLESNVGGGPSLTARARGSSRQRQLLQAAVNAFVRDDNNPSSVELADAMSGFERMDMFLITTHEDISGFKPERWLNDETRPSEWMGFGEGKRRCLGERLALCEMKVFLASLVRKVDGCDLRNSGSDGKIVWKTDSIMARPSDGVEVVSVAALE